MTTDTKTAKDFAAIEDRLRAAGLNSNEIFARMAKDAALMAEGTVYIAAAYNLSDMTSAPETSRKLRNYLKARRKAVRLEKEAQRNKSDNAVVAATIAFDNMQDDKGYSANEKKSSLEKIAAKRKARSQRRVMWDILRNSATYIFSIITLAVLAGILWYSFSTGASTLSWDFITGKYSSDRIAIQAMTPDQAMPEGENFSYSEKDGEFFSSRWGIAFSDTEAADSTATMTISYIAPDSFFTKFATVPEGESVAAGSMVLTMLGRDDAGNRVSVNRNSGAETGALVMDTIAYLTSGTFMTGGNGIGGPLVATLYMILFALAMALPLGMGGAIYLSVYARKSKLTAAMRSLIDMISGIPSIIFGLAGAIIFIPVFGGLSGGTGALGNILSGSATLACMVLPTIIKNTEEAINVIPRPLKDASLALGASQTQTVFRIIIPCSVPGILTGTLLAIGRIIGESAALVFATGASIVDNVTPTTPSAATIAVYIWKVMSGETPNVKAAAAASVLILIVVLVLNLLVKILAAKFNVFKPRTPKNFFRKKWDSVVDKRKAKKAIRGSREGNVL